jgi:peptidyl-prolyl cis-trans isomerase B (cyclophilin B)
MELKSAKKVAVLQTSKGTITFELLADLAPNHARNFADLAASGFYDGTKFHRVIPGFMIQGGDPNTKTENVASWGSGNGPHRLKAEFNPTSKASHVRGAVSMARTTDPDSASCQFFIVHQTSKFLDEQYSIFGKVLTGMEVVDAIADTPRDAGDRPRLPVVIERVAIEVR